MAAIKLSKFIEKETNNVFFRKAQHNKDFCASQSIGT